MYSLKTQDIPGARPRIRHPQRNIVRDKISPQSGYIPSATEQPEKPYVLRLPDDAPTLRNVDLSESMVSNLQDFNPPSPQRHGDNSSVLTNPATSKLYLPEQKTSQQRNPKNNNNNFSAYLPNKNRDPVNYSNNLDYSVSNSKVQPSSQSPQSLYLDQQPHSLQSQTVLQPQADTSKNNGDSSSRGIASPMGPVSRPRSIMQGTSYNIITNNKFSYQIEGYVPSWGKSK